jgi:hypothetical protein
MHIVTALTRDHCPSCWNLFPFPIPDFQTIRGGFFGPTFYRCNSCNSFSRYTLRWKALYWSVPVSAGALLLSVWAAPRIVALVPFSRTHPGWYGAILGALGGCMILACLLFAFRTSSELTTVPENKIPTSKLQPMVWRLIDYSVLSTLAFCYSFYTGRWGVFLGTLVGFTIVEVWNQSRSRWAGHMSSN